MEDQMKNKQKTWVLNETKSWQMIESDNQSQGASYWWWNTYYLEYNLWKGWLVEVHYPLDPDEVGFDLSLLEAGPDQQKAESMLFISTLTSHWNNLYIGL